MSVFTGNLEKLLKQHMAVVQESTRVTKESTTELIKAIKSLERTLKQ